MRKPYFEINENIFKKNQTKQKLCNEGKLTCMLDHLQWRRAAVPRAHHRECSLCHHLLGNLPCCQMTKTKPLQSAVLTPTLNIRMFIYRQCNDALQEDCTATVQAELWWVTFSQEGITMATSTSPASLGSVRLRDRCFPHK